MRLIGINGFMGSGKDTTFGFIQECHLSAQRTAFADKLKIMGAMAIGFEGSPEELVAKMNDCKENWTFNVWTGDHPSNAVGRSVTQFTGRQYLQWLGGNARKVFGDTFWIDQVLPPKRYHYGPEKIGGLTRRFDMLEERYPNTDLVVVTDVRYANEAERVRELGGEVWEILRPGSTSDGHSSEIPLPRELVDRVIHNGGDLSQLSAKVKEALDA